MCCRTPSDGKHSSAKGNPTLCTGFLCFPVTFLIPGKLFHVFVTDQCWRPHPAAHHRMANTAVRKGVQLCSQVPFVFPCFFLFRGNCVTCWWVINVEDHAAHCRMATTLKFLKECTHTLARRVTNKLARQIGAKKWTQNFANALPRSAICITYTSTKLTNMTN